MTYTHCDAPGFERGDMGRNKPKVARIYALKKYDPKSGVVDVVSQCAWGDLYENRFAAHTIIKLEKPIIR